MQAGSAPPSTARLATGAAKAKRVGAALVKQNRGTWSVVDDFFSVSGLSMLLAPRVPRLFHLPDSGASHGRTALQLRGNDWLARTKRSRRVGLIPAESSGVGRAGFFA